MAYHHDYNLRKRNSRPSAPPVARQNHHKNKIKTQGKLLMIFPPPPSNKKKQNNNNNNNNNNKKKKKEYAEPTHIKAIYWVNPVKKGDEYYINVAWFGLPGQYAIGLTDVLDSGSMWEVANECQLGHHEHGGFSDWFMERAVHKQPELKVGDIVYDKKDQKYLEIATLPRDDEQYVWPGYRNYFIGIGREFDAFQRVVGGGDGFVSDVDLYVYSDEVVFVANLPRFYIQQVAEDDFYHLIKSKLWTQFKKHGKPKRLRFYENLSGKVWTHYLNKRIREYEEKIDIEDSGDIKKWTLALDEANELFPVDTGSIFEKEIGIRRYFVDDMDFVFNIKKNKLRIYGVILVENIKTHAINGNDIEKR